MSSMAPMSGKLPAIWASRQSRALQSDDSASDQVADRAGNRRRAAINQHQRQAKTSCESNCQACSVGVNLVRSPARRCHIGVAASGGLSLAMGEY
jgi:hypothetical protein